MAKLPALSQKQPQPWISVAGLIVAIVAAVSANLTTIIVAFNGQTNASIQSAKEFRRNQQQAQFADFTNAASAMQDAEVSYYGTVSYMTVHPEAFDDAVIEPLRAKAESKLETLRTKLAIIRLVGSSDTITASTDVANGGTNVYNHNLYQTQKFENKQPTDSPSLDLTNKLTDDINRFVKCARNDVEANS